MAKYCCMRCQYCAINWGVIPPGACWLPPCGCWLALVWFSSLPPFFQRPPRALLPRASSSSRMLPRGWAFLTSIGLPRISRGCSKQASTAASLSKVTNPKPRGRPVSLSIMRVASTTRPNRMKYSLKSCSVASWETPPTNILLVRSCSSRGIARLGSILLSQYEPGLGGDQTLGIMLRKVNYK